MVIVLKLDYRKAKMATERWVVKVGLLRWLTGCVGNGVAVRAGAGQGFARWQAWWV